MMSKKRPRPEDITALEERVTRARTTSLDIKKRLEHVKDELRAVEIAMSDIKDELVYATAFDESKDSLYVFEPPQYDWPATEGFTKLELTIDGLLVTQEYDSEKRELAGEYKCVTVQEDFDETSIVRVQLCAKEPCDNVQLIYKYSAVAKLRGFISNDEFEAAMNAIDVKHTARYKVLPTFSLDDTSFKGKVMFEHDAQAIVYLFVKTTVFNTLGFL